jgi:hypothetical protein
MLEEVLFQQVDVGLKKLWPISYFEISPYENMADDLFAYCRKQKI